MKKAVIFLSVLLLLSGCFAPAPEETVPPAETVPTTTATEPSTIATEPETTAPPPPVVELTDEEQTMLLELGMAERGDCECTACSALVMCTVLDRGEAGRVGNSIRSVIVAPDQFTPVSDGSYDKAQPNERCYEALDLVIYGWNESQGALYYEWCKGESWHSKNLHLLFQHCDIRFYD